jgi:uncharacterized protein YjiS (DUF1127 family)
MANLLLQGHGAESRSAGPRIAARLLRALARMLRRGRERRALSRLSDDLLRDIGLTRHDVAAECRKPIWRA